MGWLFRKAPAPLATNAPDAWPRLPPYAAALTPDQQGRLAAEAHVAAALERAQTGARIRILQRNATILCEGGVIWAPMAVHDGQGVRMVHAFPSVDEIPASFFTSVSTLMKSMGHAPPVYFAPAPLPAGKPVGALMRFDPPTQTTRIASDGKPRSGWWTTPEQPGFIGSPVAAAIERANRACDGIHSYVLAAMLRAGTGLTPENARAPLQDVDLHLLGPELKRIGFSASAEKGFRWHFDPGTTSVAYRDRFYTLWAGYCETWRAWADKDGWPRDGPPGGAPLQKWESTREGVARMAVATDAPVNDRT